MYVVVENSSYSLAVFGPYETADQAETVKREFWRRHAENNFSELISYHVRQIREVEFV